MAVQRKLLTILVVINVVLQTTVIAQRRVASYEQTFSGDFTQDLHSFTSPGQVYGSCHDPRKHDNVFEADCLFLIENDKYIELADHQKVCNFKPSTEIGENEEFYLIDSIVGIDTNKAVLVWKNSNFSKIFVLHFSNCEAIPVKLNIHPKNVAVHAPFGDEFDIIFSEAEQLCDIGYLCKLTVNTQGNVVSEIDNWPGRFNEILSILRSPTKGRITVDVHETFLNTTVIRVSVSEDYYHVHVLQEYRIDNLEPEKGHKLVATSTTHQLLSVCMVLDEGFRCSQFDSNAALKFDRTFTYLGKQVPEDLSLHNLPNGGILLVSPDCREPTYESCHDAKVIDAAGNYSGAILLTELETFTMNLIHFFIDEKKEFCLSHVHRQTDSSIDSAKLDIVCFENRPRNRSTEIPIEQLVNT